MQIGVSYIPDSSNMGHSDINVDHKNAPLVSVPYKFVIKDGISYGIAYDGKLSDDLSGKLAFVGEFGKNTAFKKRNNKKADIKFKNLNTYVVGGTLIYDNISVSASYANYNKSLTSKEVDLISRDTYVYGFGVKYKLKKYAFSINQFNSNHKKSKLACTSLGVDYMVAKGLKTYIQSSFYQTNGKYLQNNIIKSDKTNGVLVVLGAKVSF